MQPWLPFKLDMCVCVCVCLCGVCVQAKLDLEGTSLVWASGMNGTGVSQYATEFPP